MINKIIQLHSCSPLLYHFLFPLCECIYMYTPNTHAHTPLPLSNSDTLFLFQLLLFQRLLPFKYSFPFSCQVQDQKHLSSFFWGILSIGSSLLPGCPALQHPNALLGRFLHLPLQYLSKTPPNPSSYLLRLPNNKYPSKTISVPNQVNALCPFILLINENYIFLK